ncbi:DNA polymerase III subunit epsilon [Phenylobacterium sp.]|jgi:DNA polymerase-3 subunit epsilon|uniref:DNA polymerase III subunit epsilon n=1 Tax=Phenylobacterium sp. TaxID=1871053 RepID=UPI002F3F1721
MAREIVLDTETTGFEPHLGHRLVEIACLELEDFVPTGRTFHKYVDPERDMPEGAQRVHGITAEFLRGKPRFAHAEVVDGFLEFVGEAPLIAHNAGFDRAFINHELGRCGRVHLPEERWIDTLALARARFPGIPNSLDALCKRFKISLAERDLHGALVDTNLLAAVYLELKGGRERRLELSAPVLVEAVAVARQNAYGPRPRALAPRSTGAERELHAAFIREAVKSDELWKKFGL